MSHTPNPERFHALDATRAFALLLGVVFHAAWSFAPAPLGAPIVDVSAGSGFYWFFFTSHTFRMQLFFLIAGFFGHLLYHRRGFSGFARHRLLRVGLPLVVSWFILFPLVVAAFVTGGNVSGGNLVELPLPLLFTLMFKQGKMFVPNSVGGLFSLTHLWFLYYLLWIYALTLGLRFLVTRPAPLASRLRGWGDGWVARVMQSPGFILWLTLGMGLFLWPMEGWFGVDTPTQSLMPSMPVLILYGSFFALGWMLHRQAGLLTGLVRHWRWQLVLGLLMSVPLFIAFRAVQDQGVTGRYPRLEAGQVKDWPAFLARLQSARQPETVPVELANLWRQFPPKAQEAILRLSDASDPNRRAGLAGAIKNLMVQPAMFGTERILPGPPPPVEVGRRAMAENRATLERLFPGSLAGDPRALSWYRPAKLAYSLGYALVMWLLVFGTVGFFQARCPEHSPAWRYVADSSYWIYLAHLPLVAVLQIWMASWPWPGVVKFALLNLIAFTVLFASYHYLVRSTFIGRMLNGQSYPFVAWPFAQLARRPGDAAEREGSVPKQKSPPQSTNRS
jgi:peptidoglycan/LPS O-acetylase OafA/YrhL